MILEKLKGNITYANVTATLALFVALSGGAYALVNGSVKSRHIADNAVRSRHIAPDAAGGSDVDESTLRIGLGVLGGQWALPQGFGGQINGSALSALDSGNADSDETMILAPKDLVIVDFYVKLVNPQPQGTRAFHVQGDGFGIDELSRKLCEIGPGERSCRSDERIEIEAGKRFRFWVMYENLAGDSNANFGYRIVSG